MIFLPWSQFKGSKTSRTRHVVKQNSTKSDDHMQKIIKHRVNSVMTFLLVVQIFFHQQYHSELHIICKGFWMEVARKNPC